MTARDDDFDRRRHSGRAGHDIAVERPHVPGKQTLVEAEQDRSRAAPAVPGRRTVAQGFVAGMEGLREAQDPVTETEFHVRKAREAIAKLAVQPPPIEARVLRADLRYHLGVATKAGPQAISRPNGRDVAASVFELMAEAEPYLADAPTGRQPGADASDGDPVSTARRGVDGPGQQLPHFDRVQRLFGSHDLSGVRAHVGGAAGEASRQLRAHAYTHGSDIAFAEEPTAALVAHEATHVIQQRAGVSLKAIDGDASDAHEQQADAVADRVAQDVSAEPLLSAITASGGGTSSPAVQATGRLEPVQDRFVADGGVAVVLASSTVSWGWITPSRQMRLLR